MDTLTGSATYDDSRPRITDTNLAPLLQVITWLSLSTMFVSVVVRMSSRRFLLQQMGMEDALVGLSFMFAIAQSLLIAAPTSPVWGRYMNEISGHNLFVGFKVLYAAAFCFFTSLCFAKLSNLVALAKISPSTLHRTRVTIVFALAVLWWLTSILIVAFQCPLPHPWNTLQIHCRSQFGIHLYANLGNAMTDVAILVLPFLVIVPSRLRIPNKVHALAWLSTRLLVIAATIIQLAYLRKAFRGDNYTFKSFGYLVCTEIVQALSVITCSLPFLIPFTKGLSSGSIFTDRITTRPGAGKRVSFSMAGNDGAGSISSREERKMFTPI